MDKDFDLSLLPIGIFGVLLLVAAIGSYVHLATRLEVLAERCGVQDREGK